MVARYVAIGTVSCQCQVSVSPLSVCDTSTPLPTAVRPSGTVMETSKVALSLGVSLAGYHVGDPCGSFTTKGPASGGVPTAPRFFRAPSPVGWAVVGADTAE